MNGKYLTTKGPLEYLDPNEYVNTMTMLKVRRAIVGKEEMCNESIEDIKNYATFRYVKKAPENNIVRDCVRICSEFVKRFLDDEKLIDVQGKLLPFINLTRRKLYGIVKKLEFVPMSLDTREDLYNDPRGAFALMSNEQARDMIAQLVDIKVHRAICGKEPVAMDSLTDIDGYLKLRHKLREYEDIHHGEICGVVGINVDILTEMFVLDNAIYGGADADHIISEIYRIRDYIYKR